MKENKYLYRGRIQQIPIYLGKCFRGFLYQDDWKMIPMASVISALVAFVACQNMCQTMEGTMYSALALSFVCIWNGLFNSVQVICRERDVVKREHRSGMHISSYVCAHMIYQAFICFVQTVIAVVVLYLAGIKFPSAGLMTPWFELDLGITFFLVTYGADILGLFISAVAKNTTVAMTAMPFVMIVQLLFSGSMFDLTGLAKKFTNLTISKWGIESICTISNYNSLPMVSFWNQLWKLRDFEVAGYRPVQGLTDYMASNSLRDNFLKASGMYNQNPSFVYTQDHLSECWLILIAFGAIFAILAIIALEGIDSDKRGQ